MDGNRVLRLELHAPDNGRRSPAKDSRAKNGVTVGTEKVCRAVKPEKLMRLLTERNLQLLRLIKSERPGSLSELARLSGRPAASLTRTIRRMSALGIIVLQRAGGRGKVPVVVCDTLRLDVPLTPHVPEYD